MGRVKMHARIEVKPIPTCTSTIQNYTMRRMTAAFQPDWRKGKGCRSNVFG